MQSVKELIYHTKTEKRSLLLLICIIASMSMVRKHLISHHTPIIEDLSYLEEYLETDKSFENTMDSTPGNTQPPKVETNKNKKEIAYQNKKIEGVSIDPNTAPADSLHLIGLSSFAVSNLMKYRSKGGQINHPQELKKIYGIDSTTYESVKDQLGIKQAKLISLPSESKPNKSNIEIHKPQKTNFNQPKKKKILIDINTADEIQLQYVKGIGPSFAKRIVKYRELIGGYHHKLQLMEVYGLDHEKYQEIKDQVRVDGNVKKLNINCKDHRSLSAHPYVSYQEAKLIAAYTKKHGPLKSAYDIVKIGVMDSLFVEKIMPYLPDSMIYHKAQTPPTSL